MNKLIEAQRLYQDYTNDLTVGMEVRYDPSSGYRMVLTNGEIFCHSIQQFDRFVERVLELARSYQKHTAANAEVREVNARLRAR